MIVEYLRYSIPQERQADFLRDYQAASVPLMQSPYANAFELCQCVDDPSQFILQIRWTSAEDHLQGFRQSSEFREFLAYVRPYVPLIDEMRHYRTVLQV